MIRIHKPDQAPAILLGRGKNKRRGSSSAYSRAPQAYRDGTREFQFDAGIYAHKTVKDALVAAQHGKCCFCESKITHVAYGDVEHFRPKKGYRQRRDDPLGRPGYYWLAYEWGNLLFSCQLCNQRHKRNLFPLRHPDRRARCHRDDIAVEQPLFINPAAEDPASRISFRAEVAYPIHGDARGKATIEALELNREALRERRSDRLAILTCLHTLATQTPVSADVRQARALLRKKTEDNAEYAAMVRAALACGFEVPG